VFRPVSLAGTVRTARLTDRSIADIVKRYAIAAGLDLGPIPTVVSPAAISS
jgi:hypothetical protein